MNKNLFILITFLLCGNFVFGQQKITADQAVKLALENSPSLKVAAQRIQKQESLKKTSFDLQAPELVFEAPTASVMRPGVLQTIEFPSIYGAKSMVLQSNVEIAKSEQKISKQSLIYEVRSTYNDWIYLFEKQKLLQEQDSFYSDILRINETRHKLGEISNLEKINGESQYKQIQYGLLQTKAELESVEFQFGFLLGLKGYIAQDAFVKIQPLMEVYDSTDILKNPYIELAERNYGLNQNQLKLAKRQRLPSFVFGFLNQGDDQAPLKYQLRYGLSVPIWQWTQTARIKAAKTDIDIARSEQRITALRLNTEYTKALAQYRQFEANLAYFESVGLRESAEILRSAKESYRLGSITYYAYLQNLELAFRIRLNYLETLRNFNKSILYIQFVKGEIQ